MGALYIIWSDKYATGIPILDEQYRGLVSLINSFFYHRADADKDIERVLVPTAEMFKGYARINFYTVEKLMIEADYPDVEKYGEKHREIMENILRVDRMCRAERDAQQFLDFLKEYWVRSVEELSAEYIGYLQEYYGVDDAQK